MRVVLAGGAFSSAHVLKALARHSLMPVGVLGHRPPPSASVSGYEDLVQVARELGVPASQHFRSINEPATQGFVADLRPDVLFVVGLSQLVRADLLSIPRIGTVGFHPTRLPEGRGRAPLAWLVEKGRSGAATFFEMSEGVDDGAILAQEPFPVFESDHVEDVIPRLLRAMDRALDDWLPNLAQGVWSSEAQSSENASWWGRRTPADGVVEWTRPVSEIDALVRAASHPHPGAFTYTGDRTVRFNRSRGRAKLESWAFPGTVIAVEWPSLTIQAGDGAIVLDATPEQDSVVRVGHRLGYSVDNEIYELRQRVRDLEEKLESAVARANVEDAV